MTFEILNFSDITIIYDKKRVPLSTMERNNRKGDFRYYGAQGVIDYVDDYIFDGKYLLIAEDGENLKSKKQNIAQIAEGKFWVNNHAHIVQCNNKCRIEYLCFLLNSMDLSGYITGSAQPKLSQTNLNHIQLKIPPIEIQDLILERILPLERKIAINTAINENLEQQAQAILKNYMDSYDYKLVPLSTIAEVIDCLHSKKPEQIKSGNRQLLQLENIKDDGFLDLTYKYLISESDYQNWIRKCEIHEGDCVITNVGRIGAVAQAPRDTHVAMGRNMTCIRLKQEYKLQAYFITVLLSDHMRKEIQYNTDEGTIMGSLNVKNIPKLQFPFFDSEKMISLEQVLFSLRKQFEENYLQNQLLSALRDTLLPKLMNGEINVSGIQI